MPTTSMTEPASARRPARSVRRATAVLLLALLGSATAPLRPASAEKVADDEALNYLLRLPDRWDFLPVGRLSDLGVVKVAEAKLETLADGSPGKGHGARLLLSVQDVNPKTAPGLDPAYEEWLREWQELVEQSKQVEQISEELREKIDAAYNRIDKQLMSLAEKPEVLSLVMSRWGGLNDRSSWPVYRLEDQVRLGGVPAAKVAVDDASANLAGTDGPCHAVQFVYVLRKKIVRLALWRWPAPRDKERLRDDLDMIELNFEVLKAEALGAKKPSGAKPPPPDDAPKKEGKRETVRDVGMGFEVVKPARFEAKDVDRSKDSERNLGFELKAEDAGSDAIVELLVYRVGRPGAVAFSLDDWIRNVGTNFITAHPQGAIEVLPFAAPSAKAPFLSLPDLAKKKEIKRPSAEDLEKRLSKTETEKLGIVSDAKNAKIGHAKLRETWRFGMKGSLERVGADVQLQYVFTYETRTYVLRVTMRRDGVEKFGAEVAEILKSLTLLDDPK